MASQPTYGWMKKVYTTLDDECIDEYETDGRQVSNPSMQMKRDEPALPQHHNRTQAM